MDRLKCMFLFLLVVAFFVICSKKWYWNDGQIVFAPPPHLNVQVEERREFGKKSIEEKVFSSDNPPLYTVIGLHLIIPLILPKRLDSLDLNAPKDAQVVLRNKEIIECLRQNLQNEMIASITIFFKDEKLPEYITSLDLKDAGKLIFFNQSEDPSLKVIFGYVSQHLIHKVVMVANQDVVLDPTSTKRSI